ncbi:MAG TPA: DMT family transporter [Dehalococcoidia bacterium]|nr:DMT family transporter [Dehalococcoidia bacterium]
MSGRGFDLAILAIGVAAVSTAAVLIREADAPSLVIASYRLVLASLPLLLLAGVRRQPVLPSNRSLVLLTLLSGVFLAAHFGLWVAAVKQTSIITSVVLVTTTPLFVGLAGGPLLGERPGRTIWLALAITTVGTLIMVSEDFDAGRDTLEGDGLALLAAIFASGYLMVGRRLLGTGAGWLPYITVTYATGAVLLLGAVLVTGGAMGGYSGRTYSFFVLLALVPQLLGHTAVNRSLGHLPAIVVSVAVLGEPVGATILAVIFLNEDPTLVQALGGLLVLAGVATGVRGDVQTRPVLAPEAT